MTPAELIRSLEVLDAELHSYRLTSYYRGFPTDVRERFVALRAYVARALGDARNAELTELTAALHEQDRVLRTGLDEVQAAVSGLADAVRVLDVIGDVLEALARSVPGVLNGVLPGQ